MPQTSSEWAFWVFTTLVLGFFVSLAAGLVAEPLTPKLFERRQKKKATQIPSQSLDRPHESKMSLVATTEDKSLKSVLDEIHKFRVDTEFEITGSVVLGVMGKLSPTYLRLVRSSQRYHRLWLSTVICVGVMLIAPFLSVATNMVALDKSWDWLYMLVVTLLFGISIILLVIYVRQLVLLQTTKSYIEVKNPMPIRWVKP